MVYQTLLLCFIHGFKVAGQNETFEEFPEHLRDLIKENVPDRTIESRVYPRYETRGDLPGAVIAFRGWLVEQVLSLEKAANNPKPIQSPTVGVILVGHSMGGLVAADTLFSFLDDTAGDQDEQVSDNVGDPGDAGGRVLDGEKADAVFPAIQGILSFDTPYCGLSRAMFAYGAFAQYQQVSSAYGLVTSLSSLKLPSSYPTASTASDIQEDSGPAFKLWQAIAMQTGAAGAIAAAGAAAYMYREQIGQGVGYLNKKDISAGLSAVNRDNFKQMFSSVSSENIQQGLAYISRENLSHGMAWMSGHLEFVGALMRAQELQDRIGRLSALHGLGFADLYTSLGPNSYWSGGYFVAERTFCAIPPEKTEPNKFYVRELNSKAKDEIAAHMNMFNKPRNPGYEEMSERARGLVLSWINTYEARIEDPYPERRRKQVEIAADLERTKAKYPQLTRYTYGDGGFQEGKVSGWIPSMPAVPKPSYPLLPSYASMPTYEGVTSYLPSIPYWSSGTEPEQKAVEESAKQSGTKPEGEGQEAVQEQPMSDADAMNLNAQPDAQSMSQSQGVPQDSANKDNDATRDDNDLFGTLKRTGSIPGVTEDLIFQLAADVDAARAQDAASKEEALGASMAEEVPMEQANAGAQDAMQQSEQAPASEQLAANAVEAGETETLSTQDAEPTNADPAAPSEGGHQELSDSRSDADGPNKGNDQITEPEQTAEMTASGSEDQTEELATQPGTSTAADDAAPPKSAEQETTSGAGSGAGASESSSWWPSFPSFGSRG